MSKQRAVPKTPTPQTTANAPTPETSQGGMTALREALTTGAPATQISALWHQLSLTEQNALLGDPSLADQLQTVLGSASGGVGVLDAFASMTSDPVGMGAMAAGMMPIPLLLLYEACTNTGLKPGEELEAFEDREIAGFDIKVQKAMLADTDLWPKVEAQLEKDLTSVIDRVPPGALSLITDTVLWVQTQGAPGTDLHEGPVFHPDRQWLEDNGMQPDKAGGIEVRSGQTYLDWKSGQPDMILHELTHALHADLGSVADEITAAYDAAMAAGLYDNVERNDGTTGPAYAKDNEQEYFAELTEAYFGENDFYPYTRDELKSHDPAGYAVVEKIWNLSGGQLTAP